MPRIVQLVRLAFAELSNFFEAVREYLGIDLLDEVSLFGLFLSWLGEWWCGFRVYWTPLPFVVANV